MIPPTEEEQIDELVAHLNRVCGQWCPDCGQEFEIRRLFGGDVEAWNLYNVEMERQLAEMLAEYAS